MTEPTKRGNSEMDVDSIPFTAIELCVLSERKVSFLKPFLCKEFSASNLLFKPVETIPFKNRAGLNRANFWLVEPQALIDILSSEPGSITNAFPARPTLSDVQHRKYQRIWYVFFVALFLYSVCRHICFSTLCRSLRRCGKGRRRWCPRWLSPHSNSTT